MQIQPILGYFWAIFGLYQPPGPPFNISWIHPCVAIWVAAVMNFEALDATLSLHPENFVNIPVLNIIRCVQDKPCVYKIVQIMLCANQPMI